MPVYVYETIPQKPGQEPERFELRQSMRDAALTHHPESGIPVKRIITGGYGFMGLATEKSAPPSQGQCCGHGGGCGCGCH